MWYSIGDKVPKKNEDTSKPEPGMMTFMCSRCKNTVFFSVNLELFAMIKARGPKEFRVPCETCGDTLHLTLVP